MAPDGSITRWLGPLKAGEEAAISKQSPRESSSHHGADSPALAVKTAEYNATPANWPRIYI